MWTEEVLADREAAMRRPHLLPPGQPWGHDLVVAQGTRDAWAELYRLARLGLAAEQVGHGLEAVTEACPVGWDSTIAVRAFLDHPAWRDK